MRLVFLGAPGVGKGTIAETFSAEAGLAHISTGAILREQIKEGSDLGKAAKSYIDAGDLVPDKLVSDMLAEHLKNCKRGYILDGYPRTIEQAKFLDDLLDQLETPLNAVVLVEIPEKTIVERLTSRLTCKSCGAIYNTKNQPSEKEGICDKCGHELIQRDDDKEEVIVQRLKTYESKTKPLIDFYKKKDLLLTVDNSGSPEEAVENLKQVLSEKEE